MVAWEFLAAPHAREEFVRAYGPGGDWAALFTRAEGFLDVTLLEDRENEGRFVTLDRWVDEAAFRAFRGDARLASAYDALDRVTAALTVEERRLGAFDEARP